MGTILRDGVWGDIRLGPRELALVDTPAFQRLRRVRQLGFCHLVFPGANHTRFEHSLGVAHLASLALQRLEGLQAEDAERRAFLAAALLHDVGHYPFSHAVEELEVSAIRRHEDVARDLIVSGEVAGVLRERWEVDPELVARLVAGGALEGGAAVLGELLDSSLDVDKLDYLVRDARAANVPYGAVDAQRLVASLRVWEGRLAVERKGVAALQSLVFAKHLMFATVYWHHACRAAVAMLLRAIQEALEAGALGPGELERADDASLVASLAGGGMPDLTRRLAERLRLRRLYKRAVEVGWGDAAFQRLEQLWFDPWRRREVEDGWAAELGAEPGSVLCDVPEPRAIDVGLPVVVEAGGAVDWDEVSALGRAELERLQRGVRRIRIFAADAELASRLRAAAPSLLAFGC